MVEELKELIAVASYSSHEDDFQSLVYSKLQKGGLSPFMQGKNVVAKLEGQDSSKVLVFNSHSDVVDAGDLSKWKIDPFKPEVVDDRLYGRGAADMKTGLLGSIEVARRLANISTLPYDVWFTYVIQEELDGLGTQEFAKWFQEEGYLNQYKTKGAIFTEPTNLKQIGYGHRGNYFLKAHMDGEAGHSSRPNLIEKHAIREMVSFLNDLEQHSISWREQHTSALFEPTSITPTSFIAESGSPNKTADSCDVILDLRTIPNYHTGAYEEVLDLAKKRGISLSFVCSDSPSGYTDPEARIIKSIQSIVPDSEPTIFQSSADLGFLTQIGFEGAIFGPGTKDAMHQINEWVKVEDILRTPDLYHAIYYEYGEDFGEKIKSLAPLLTLR